MRTRSSGGVAGGSASTSSRTVSDSMVQFVASKVGAVKRRKYYPMSIGASRVELPDTESEDDDYYPNTKRARSDDSDNEPTSSPSSPRRTVGRCSDLYVLKSDFRSSRRKTESIQSRNQRRRIKHLSDSSDNDDTPRAVKPKVKASTLTLKNTAQDRFIDDVETPPLPHDVWVKILIFALLKNENRDVRLSELIRLSPICRAAWYAHYDTRIFAHVDTFTALRLNSRSTALRHFKPYFTPITEHLRVGRLQDKHVDDYFADVQSLITNLASTLRSIELVNSGAQKATVYMSPTILSTIMSDIAKLTHLDIDGYSFQTNTVKLLTNNLLCHENGRHLQGFSLDNCHLSTGESVNERLFRHFDKWTCANTLRVLVLMNTNIHVQLHVSVLLKMPQLRVLRVVGVNRVSVYELPQRARGAPAAEPHNPTGLRVLSIEELQLAAPISTDAFTLPARPNHFGLIAMCTQLRELYIETPSLDGGYILSYDQRFTLDLHNALRRNTALRVLYLNRVHIIDTDEIMSGDEYAFMPLLERLSLVNISESACNTVLRRCAAHLQQDNAGLAKLSHLNLSYSSSSPKLLCRVLRSIVPTLRTLDLTAHKSAPRGFKQRMEGRKQVRAFIDAVEGDESE